MTLTADTSALYKIRQYLPQNVSSCLSRLDKGTLDRITEIRLRKNSLTTVTLEGQNYILCLTGLSSKTKNGIFVTENDIEDFIYKFCKGSIYSHENTLKDFFVTNSGIRVGLSGQAIYKGGSLQGIGKVTGVNIRLPRHIKNVSEEILAYIEKNGFKDGKGFLLLSKPGVGKTTFLRDLAANLSHGSNTRIYRVCVIDERCEIYMDSIFTKCCCDFLSGIDKIKGLEIASRVLSPEIIICDEISGPDEAEKIIRHKNGGIVFIASVHSDSFEDALGRDYIKNMFTKGVFSHLCLLERNKEGVSVSIKAFEDDN